MRWGPSNVTRKRAVAFPLRQRTRQTRNADLTKAWRHDGVWRAAGQVSELVASDNTIDLLAAARG